MASLEDKGGAVDNAQEPPSTASAPQAEQSPSFSCDVRPKHSAFQDKTHKQGKEEELANVTTPQDFSKNDEHSWKKSLSEAEEEEPEDRDEQDQSLASMMTLESAKDPICSDTLKEVPICNIPLNFPFVNEYTKDHYIYVKECEVRFLLPDYMRYQRNITKKMRAGVVNWFIVMQERFNLPMETIYLAVKLLDHFLAREIIQRHELQVIGMTALFIACKFEDYRAPTVNLLLDISNEIDKDMISYAEERFLEVIEYNISIPVAYPFLLQFAKYAHTNLETLTLARYICELTLQNYNFVQDTPSQLASACILLALKMKKFGSWNPSLEEYCGYTVHQLLPLVRKLNFMLTYQNKKLNAVHKKYSRSVFFQVAKTPLIDKQKLEEVIQS